LSNCLCSRRIWRHYSTNFLTIFGRFTSANIDLDQRLGYANETGKSQASLKTLPTYLRDVPARRVSGILSRHLIPYLESTSAQSLLPNCSPPCSASSSPYSSSYPSVISALRTVPLEETVVMLGAVRGWTTMLDNQFMRAKEVATHS